MIRLNILRLLSAFIAALGCIDHCASRADDSDIRSDAALATTPEAENRETFSSQTTLHKPLVEPLTSFGATVLGEYLYVFSGHGGGMHGFGKDQLVNHFRRIKFDDPAAEWEELAMHDSAQSPGLVNDGHHIYRIGGLTFRNSGQDSETHFESTSYFARYNVEQNIWTELTPLPEPRSSLDAAILGKKIYVAGGWDLQGSSANAAPWHDDMLMFDLEHPDRGWQSLPGPGYDIRAISLAAHEGKIYLLGGITSSGTSRRVSVFDPDSQAWTDGPELNADSRTAGFATGSFAVGQRLYVTGGSGVLYRLATDGQDWEIADRLLYPRMFLRLLPVGEDRLLALGGTGSSGSGRLGVVESLRVDPERLPEAKRVAWSVPYTGRAKHSQTLVLDGHKLYAFGGNASWESHDFSPDAFVDEAFVFDIAAQTIAPLPAAPSAFQSAAGVMNRQTSEHRTIALLGGLGMVNDQFSSRTEVLEFDPESQTWSSASSSLPQPVGMFEAVAHDEAIWMFGGSDTGHNSQLHETVLHWWGDTTPVAPLPDVSLPHPRRSFAGAVLDKEYFMIGGLERDNTDGKNKIIDQVDVFNFENRTWRSAATPSVSRVFPTVCSDGTKLYLFGGFTNRDGHFAECATLECYDSDLDQWSVIADEVAGVDASMRMMSVAGRLLFFGIDRETSHRANFVLYDPTPTATPATVEGTSFSSRQPGSEAERNAKLMMRRDSNKDGKLSVQELGSRFAAFISQADQDQDGLVSLAEVKAQLEAEEATDE